MELKLPLINAYVRYIAKDSTFTEEYEDAFQVRLESGRAAIADGVTGAMFSKLWSQILTQRLVEEPPPVLLDLQAWWTWLEEPRRIWMDNLNFPTLTIHQKTKLRQVGGAFATLCLIELHSVSSLDGELGCCHMRSIAIGDCCLFHVRCRRLLTSFPLTKSDEFDFVPDSVCSIATRRDEKQILRSYSCYCLHGDALLLVTDAIARWLLESIENGSQAPWEALWDLDQTEWANAIEGLRDANLLKRDDTTMVVIQIGSDGIVAVPAESNARVSVS